eukprot:TRINITY_DN7732_c0_g2_i2.p1 TRINITY_DN7732_c0_g2~~TRINITY_DN7732_c0_g2_i2.p1  ORF type:complete len:259 (-),score=23.69 TRINITY_DN7732_c0_g2_i2:64-840(-)
MTTQSSKQQNGQPTISTNWNSTQSQAATFSPRSAISVHQKATDRNNFFQILIDNFTSQYSRRNHQLGLQAPCNILYSLAVLQLPPAMTEPVLEILQKGLDQYVELNESQMRQVYLAHQFYKEFQGHDLKIPREVLNIGREKLKLASEKSRKKVSPGTKAMFGIMEREFGEKQVQLRMPVEDGILNVDIGFPQSDKKFGLKIMDKFDFFVNKPEQMTQKTLVNIQLLEKLGWKILQVDEGRRYDRDYLFGVIEQIRENI